MLCFVFMRDIVLAFRNVLRNKRRSLLTSLVLVIGVMSLCLFGYYNESIHYFFGNSVIAQRGHFQIFKQGYLEGDASSLENAITKEESAKICDILTNTLGNIKITERLNVSGLIGDEYGSTVFVGIGLKPENELNLLNLAYSTMSFASLSSSDNILVGKKLMDKMKLHQGKRVLLIGMTESGSMGAVNPSVAGSVATGVSYSDDTMVLANIEVFQQMLNTDRVHSVVVLIEDLIDTKSNHIDPELINILEDKFRDANLLLEIKTWVELDPMYSSVVKLFDSVFIIIYIILLLVIVITMTNAIYMSVMERVNEVGTLMAIGASKMKIMGTFLLEGFLLSVFSAVIGGLLSIVVALVLNRMNIYLPPYPGQSESYPISFIIQGEVIVLSSLFIICGSILSSLLPSIKAISMKPVDALRYV